MSELSTNYIYIPYIIKKDKGDYCPAYITYSLINESQTDVPEGSHVISACFDHDDMAFKLSIFIRMLHECRYFELTGTDSVKIFIKEYFTTFSLVTQLVVRYSTRKQKMLIRYPDAKYRYDRCVRYEKSVELYDGSHNLKYLTFKMSVYARFGVTKPDFDATRFLTRRVRKRINILLKAKYYMEMV